MENFLIQVRISWPLQLSNDVRRPQVEEEANAPLSKKGWGFLFASVFGAGGRHLGCRTALMMSEEITHAASPATKAGLPPLPMIGGADRQRDQQTAGTGKFVTLSFGVGEASHFNYLRKMPLLAASARGCRSYKFS